MKEEIRFICEPNDTNNQGTTILTDDGSMVFSSPSPICAFSIYPYHWSFEITTSVISENIYALEYCLGNQVLLNCTTTNLAIPPSITGRVYVTLSFSHADGVYYSDYERFMKEKYFDPQKRIIAVGNIHAVGQCIEFTKGHYVVIDDHDRLIAVYVQVSP